MNLSANFHFCKREKQRNSLLILFKAEIILLPCHKVLSLLQKCTIHGYKWVFKLFCTFYPDIENNFINKIS